ncbi:hypothetical protein JDV02_004283 [Purpureocillium takamizusanense]|uniref:Uncharacterized protein n=1 Tax=Purpureocillium takamizusanense TaxID=2060973 RepID=A0A9Q8QEY9_9HYPO|nr:uncharacterized protein JDV02_004283 [Purpureocillium takamizusanense]UNI17981.1 hypothetical protein JDV02_004283 [Purpureocillium takamizusanense]
MAAAAAAVEAGELDGEQMGLRLERRRGAGERKGDGADAGDGQPQSAMWMQLGGEGPRRGYLEVKVEAWARPWEVWRSSGGHVLRQVGIDQQLSCKISAGSTR